MAAPSQAQFRLLDLPAELRQEIFSHILVYPSVVTQLTHPELYSHRLIKHSSPAGENVFYSGPANPSRFNLPTITRVNKFIRHESLAVFFGKNRFLLSEAMTNGWLFQLDDDTIAYIRKIRLDYDINHDPVPTTEHPAPPPSPSSPSSARSAALHTLTCNITLQTSKPYCLLELDRKPRDARCDEFMQLKTRVKTILLQTIAGREGVSFNLAWLMELWECWVLWCNSLLAVQKKADAAQNIAKATRHAMEIRLRIREDAMKRKRIAREIDDS